MMYVLTWACANIIEVTTTPQVGTPDQNTLNSEQYLTRDNDNTFIL